MKNWAALTNCLVTFVEGQEGQMASQMSLYIWSPLIEHNKCCTHTLSLGLGLYRKYVRLLLFFVVQPQCGQVCTVLTPAWISSLKVQLETSFRNKHPSCAASSLRRLSSSRISNAKTLALLISFRYTDTHTHSCISTISCLLHGFLWYCFRSVKRVVTVGGCSSKTCWSRRCRDSPSTLCCWTTSLNTQMVRHQRMQSIKILVKTGKIAKGSQGDDCVLV